MSSFRDNLRWYNNKSVVPTLEGMQKMIDFHHDKDIDMLKFGCSLPNLANICLHNSTDAIFYPFTEGDKDLLEKIRDVVGGSSIVFTRRADVDETFFRKSNLCKSIVGIHASQLYPYSMCHPVPTVFIRVGIRTQEQVDSYLDKTRPAALKIWSYPISNEQDLIVKLRASILQADRRKLTASVLMGFVLNAILCLKQGVAFIIFVPVKSSANFSLKDIFNVVARRESSLH